MNPAQMHGTLPWRNDHNPRSLLFKFVARTTTRSGPSREVYTPEIYWVEDACVDKTAAERGVMHGPGFLLGRDLKLRLSVNSDGRVKTELSDGAQ